MAPMTTSTPTGQRLAIVGSTRLAGHPDAERIIAEVLEKYQPSVVVSGGAKGIDSMAEAAAKSRGIPVDIHRPAVQRWWGPGGFKERNLKIAAGCDILVRIASWKSKTYGSGWTRDRAKELGKVTEEFIVRD